jgi:hypothetical protein
MLPEDTLLDIFGFYQLDAMKHAMEWSATLLLEVQRPWKWHRIAHVCRKWRHVLSMSPRRLDLRILCEYGAPIESILGSWPTLPLVVRYEDPKSKSLPDNVIVALRRPHRICEIGIVLRRSVIRSIAEAIQEPFQALEIIRITVENATGPPLLVREAFLGGSAPRLREIRLDGIAFPFPAIRQVLLSTNNLVDLHLPNIPNDAYFSPDDLVTGLSTLVQLKQLTIGFHSPASCPPPSTMCPPLQRTTLPSLISLDFHGATEYLEEFVSRIDVPALCTIVIKLFNQIFFDIPQFCRFIPRVNALASPDTLFITHCMQSVYFIFRWMESRNDIYLETQCGRLDWQLSFVTQISSQLSLLSSVRILTITKNNGFPTGEEDVDSTQWLELFQPFTHVTQVRVSAKELGPAIARALVSEGTTTEILPELTKLELSGDDGASSVGKAVEQFVATRRLSGRAIEARY